MAKRDQDAAKEGAAAPRGLDALSPEQREERQRMRELLGAGADSQLGVIEGETASGVVPTEHPRTLGMIVTKPIQHEPVSEERQREIDMKSSAHHLTDPSDGSSVLGSSRDFGGATGAGTGTTGTVAGSTTSTGGSVSRGGVAGGSSTGAASGGGSTGSTSGQ